MNFQFETSLGTCYGCVSKFGRVSFENESHEKLLKLYKFREARVDVKWVKFILEDVGSGSPEYKIVYID